MKYIKVVAAVIIKEKKVLYNYKADQKEDKWNSEVLLEPITLNELPQYITYNLDKYKDWIDK